jgi:hypothetical protein
MDFDVKFLIKFSACVLIGFGLAVFSPQIKERYNLMQGKNITDKTIPSAPDDVDNDFKNLPTPDFTPPDTDKPSDEESLKQYGYTVFTPNQDTYTCPDMSILVKHIQDAIDTKNVYFQTDTKTYPPAIMYRTSSSRPFYRLSPAYSYIVTTKDDRIDALGPDITTTFTEKLQAQKFTLRSENSMADMYYDYSLTSFEKDGWLYTIQLGQGIGAGIGIELTCAPSSIKDSQAARDFDEIADVQSLREHYSPFFVYNNWTFTDNVYTININRMFSNGAGEYWGKVNGTWKFLTSTQDLPQCEPFIENKVGKGISCYACKEISADGSCLYPTETKVEY